MRTRSVLAMFLAAFALSFVTTVTVVRLRGQTAAPAPAASNGELKVTLVGESSAEEQIATLRQQLFDRDNDVLHYQTELANCRASIDSASLTARAKELTAQCEATYHVPCTWNDSARRVVLQPKTDLTKPQDQPAPVPAKEHNE